MRVRVKHLIVAGVIGGSAYMLLRPVPQHAATTSTKASADTTSYGNVSMAERIRYNVGAVGSMVMGGAVRSTIHGTEQSLKDMSVSIRNAQGGDGVRARDLQRKIMYMDSVALAELDDGHPLKAMKTALEAKNLLNSVRQNLKQTI